MDVLLPLNKQSKKSFYLFFIYLSSAIIKRTPLFYVILYIFGSRLNFFMKHAYLKLRNFPTIFSSPLHASVSDRPWFCKILSVQTKYNYIHPHIEFLQVKESELVFSLYINRDIDIEKFLSFSARQNELYFVPTGGRKQRKSHIYI